MNIQEYLYSKPPETLINEIFVNVCEETKTAWHGLAEITILTRHCGSTVILTPVGTKRNPLFKHSEENLKCAALKQYRLKNLRSETERADYGQTI